MSFLLRREKSIGYAAFSRVIVRLTLACLSPILSFCFSCFNEWSKHASTSVQELRYALIVLVLTYVFVV